MEISALIDQHLDAFINHYKHLHQNPELSFRENHTSLYIESQLKTLNLKVHRLDENAVLGYLHVNSDAPIIGIRSEMDALPITEDTGVSFASKNAGIMHACGHDLHMTCALGAATILAQAKAQLKNNVLFIFQHGEEKIPGGAKDILKAEFFKTHQPQLMVALHSFPDLKAGETGFRSGAYMASSDEIDIYINGPGGHAAMPHKTTDTITIAANIIVSLQQITSRYIPSEVPAVLSFGNIVTNSVMNIIPPEVLLEGTFRIMNEPWREKGLKQIQQVVEHVAKSMNASSEVIVRKGFPSVFNHPEYTEQLQIIAAKAIGSNQVHDIPVRMTADDFGYYAQKIPSVYFRLGVANQNGKCHGLHTSHFLPDFRAIKTGIKTLSSIISEFDGSQHIKSMN